MELGLGLRKKNHVSNKNPDTHLNFYCIVNFVCQSMGKNSFYILGVNFSQKIFQTALRKIILENAMTQGGQNGLIQICISKQRGNLIDIINIEHELLFQTKFLYHI